MRQVCTLFFPILLVCAGPLVLGAQEVFTVTHYETSALAGAWDLALQFFQAAHPGAKAAVQVLDSDEVRQNTEDILMGDSPPDVLEFVPGEGTVGAASAGGRFRSLTVDAVRRGWDKLLPPGIQPWLLYDVRGRQGTGLWYGVPSTGDFLQVYYNRNLFRKYGMKIPGSLADLEVSLEVFRKAGVVPLALGAAGYPCQELFYELFLAKADRQEAEDYQSSRGTAGFRSPAWNFAAQTLAAWAAAGYFGPAPQDLDANGQLAEFEEGNTAMTVLGAGAFSRLQQGAAALDWGTFLFPGNLRHVGGIGNILVLPVRSPHPDWAADFVGLTLRTDVQTALADRGGLALAADLNRVTNPGARGLIRTFYQLQGENRLALFPDWPAVGFYDSLSSGCLDLVRGVPPYQVLDDLDLAYRTKKRAP